MITNTEAADALDLAIAKIAIPNVTLSGQFTCNALESLALVDEVISRDTADHVKGLITESIDGWGTFNGYYYDVLDLHGDFEELHAHRVSHMRALSDKIRNGEV